MRFSIMMVFLFAYHLATGGVARAESADQVQDRLSWCETQLQGAKEDLQGETSGAALNKIRGVYDALRMTPSRKDPGAFEMLRSFLNSQIASLEESEETLRISLNVLSADYRNFPILYRALKLGAAGRFFEDKMQEPEEELDHVTTTLRELRKIKLELAEASYSVDQHALLYEAQLIMGLAIAEFDTSSSSGVTIVRALLGYNGDLREGLRKFTELYDKLRFSPNRIPAPVAVDFASSLMRLERTDDFSLRTIARVYHQFSSFRESPEAKGLFALALFRSGQTSEKWIERAKMLSATEDFRSDRSAKSSALINFLALLTDGNSTVAQTSASDLFERVSVFRSGVSESVARALTAALYLKGTLQEHYIQEAFKTYDRVLTLSHMIPGRGAAELTSALIFAGDQETTFAEAVRVYSVCYDLPYCNSERASSLANAILMRTAWPTNPKLRRHIRIESLPGFAQKHLLGAVLEVWH